MLYAIYVYMYMYYVFLHGLDMSNRMVLEFTTLVIILLCIYMYMRCEIWAQPAELPR